MTTLSSPARVLANQRNAQKSTGPRTTEGKNRSRGNALKHGLTAEVLLTSDEQATVAANPSEPWQAQYAAVLATRIDRAHQAEESERDRAALRAEVCWDQDRALDADRVAGGLARRPDRVVARLKTTPQGCSWLILRWEWLLTAAAQDGGWTDDQQALSRQLQGIPTDFTETEPAPGPVAADPRTLAMGQIEHLSALREALRPVDASEREAARQGLDDAASPGLQRAIRYVGTLFRRLRWCLEGSPEPAANPAPAPPPPPPPPVAARPTPAPTSFVDWTDEDDAMLADLDAWLAEHPMPVPSADLPLTAAAPSSPSRRSRPRLPR